MANVTQPRALPDWIAAIVRPYSDEGTVWSARAAPVPADDLRAAVLPKVSSHVKSVCDWASLPEEDTHRLGDYSFYVLTFSLSDVAALYVQVWSEPEEAVLIEVSSGASNPGAAPFLTEDRRARIVNRGFEIGGQAQNYRKRVVIDAGGASDRIAREMVDVLLACFEFDGTRDLRFHRVLETRAKAGWVYDALNSAMLVRLLRRAGYVVLTDERRSAEIIPLLTPPLRCVAALSSERDADLGDFVVLTLRAAVPCPAGLVAHRAEQINDTYRFVTAWPDAEHDAVVVSQACLLEGGVTEDHLLRQLDLWKALLTRVAAC